MKTKIILDVDTGTDDAVALMTAALAPEIDLVAATSVNGNQPIDITTENTLRVFEYIGKDIPVYRGCKLPMVSTLTPGRKPDMPKKGKSDVHGDYLPIPPATRKEANKHAVNFLVDTYMTTTDEITLVPVGPLTNIAMALRLEPRIAERIPEIVIMGGGHTIGNKTLAAEFNIWVDPEAARIVMQCGRPIRLVPLDATHAAFVTWEESEELARLGTPAADAASRFIQGRIKGYNKMAEQIKPSDSAPLHDALCIAALIDPSVLTNVVHCYVDVECSGELTDGRTVCDVQNRSGKEPNAYVALHADRLKFRKFLFDTLSRTA